MFSISLRSRLTRYAAFIALFSFYGAALAQMPLSPEEALLYLQKGNERFMSGRLIEKHYSEELPILAEGQHPFAIVLTCADSRVAPEVLFDQTLGKLFVIRVAGNVADPVVLGSLEYAVEHLHAPLLIILGHEKCGAVSAAVSGGAVPPNIGSIVKRITPAVAKVRAQIHDESKVLDEAIKENVRLQMQMATFESEVLSEFAHQQKLQIVGGVYNLHTGRVEMISQLASVDHARSDKPAASAPHDGHSPALSQPGEHAAPTQEKKAKPANEKAKPASKGKETPHAAARESRDDRTQFVALENRLQMAYDDKAEVIARTNLLMRDSSDRCLTRDCRSIPAGERVKIASPAVLSVMGRPQVKGQSTLQTSGVLRRR